MASFFQLASGGASRYSTSSGNVYKPDPTTGLITVPCPDPGRDLVDLQAAGCRLLALDATKTYYRMNGTANTTFTCSTSGHQYTTDSNGNVLVPSWLSSDAQSLLSQSLTLNGIV